ncbi:MAG: hypothetical protein ACLTK8_00105 [Paeniclostridium sp.]
MLDPKVQSTVDADALVKMVNNNEIPSCIAEGPGTFDVAFDEHATNTKV